MSSGEKTPATAPTHTTPILRSPTPADAAGIWQLVVDSGVLDHNSPYSYLILCKHFADTCIVAEEDAKIVGFVTAYRPPISPNVVFVWQIGVAASMRGRGLGGAILNALVHQPACKDVTYLDATVTPSNTASQAMFRAFARRMKTQCVEELCFPEQLFPTEGHEAEYLFHIGPFNVSQQQERSVT